MKNIISSIKLKYLSSELLAICLKISVIVTIVECVIMFVILPNVDHSVSSFYENMIDPLILVLVSSPVIAFWIIRPYIKNRDANEYMLNQLRQEAKNEHDAREKLLSEQAQQLKESIEEATLEIRLSKERYEMVSMATNDGLWDWHVETGNVYFSSRWKEIIGFKDDEFPNDSKAWAARLHKEDRERIINTLLSASVGEDNSTGEFTYRLLNKEEEYIWVHSKWIKVTSEQGVRLVGALTDITERRRMEEQLKHDSLHDGLTGLPNRTLLYDRIQQTLLRFKRNENEKFVLLFVDVDNFKRLNDTLGHLAGDKILLEIGSRLTTIFRDSDTVARLGGDEFAILMPYFQSQDDVEQLLERMLSFIQKPIVIGQTTVTTNVSVGAVVSGKHHQNATPEKILMDADLALYRTKDTKKGSFSFFKLSMRDKMVQQFEIENSLKDALCKNEIQVFYQPIVDISVNKISGFEALMRWKHPRHGWVSPVSFIPVAEESEIINKLGVYILNQSLGQLSKWNQDFGRDDWFVSVNVSGRQFESDDVVRRIQEALNINRLASKQLKIELTESVLITSKDELQVSLETLSRMGVRLAIDDFGTGYSSLGTFSRYPFHTIKIDKSFIDDLESNEMSRNMVQIIQTLADARGMKTIAEGVEEENQIKLLKECRCQYVQGYYFSRPLPSDELNSLLKISMNPLDWNLKNVQSKAG